MNLRRRRPGWWLPESAASDEGVHAERRRFLAALGLGGAASLTLGLGLRSTWEHLRRAELPLPPRLTAARNTRFDAEPRPLTSESDATRYNNFYEFGTDKRRVPHRARDFQLSPYSLRIDGLVERPGSYDLGRIEALGLEERVYRLRCVEAWAMTVPWIGVPLAKLLELAGPQRAARYLALQSFDDPTQAPEQSSGLYPFPYYEALRLDEALHPLTLLATGMYGRRLRPQNGAPLRIVLPWKYGYKSAKSLVRLTLTDRRPPTFWNDLEPSEYGWLSNVDPSVAHPRWSQRHERLLGSGARVETQPYNGYGPWVADLYGAA